jgi:mannitol/fructose-specific phosphotransferase system IIA component (Ntr-type)
VDGAPVDLIFLLVSPLDQTGPHIQALAGISRLLTDPTFRRQIKIASSGPEVYQLVCDQCGVATT